MDLRILFFLLCTLTSSLFAVIDQDHDKQVWLRSGVYGKFNDQWNASCTEELRWGNDASKLYTQITQIFINYKPIPLLQFGAAYRNTSRLENARTRNWFQAYSGIGTLTFFRTMKDWKLSNRNWIQRESFPKKIIRDFWLYRNRTTLMTPICMITPKMPFYIYDEVFFRQRRGFFQNRLGAGFAINWTENTTGFIEGLYRRIELANTWRSQTVFNFEFSFTF